MRRLLLLSLGVLCGALAVSGQEHAGGDDLTREIERLKKLLADKIAEATPPEEERVVLRTYDVADLREGIRNQGQPFEDLWPSGYELPEPPEPPEPMSFFEIDSLIEMIKSGIEPQFWETEGSSIEPKNGRLFVNAIPRVHAKIERNLAWCRQVMDRRVSVEVAVVPVKEADTALLSAALELSADEARRLAAQALGAVTLSGWDGQILGGRAGREISYVQDLDAEDPIMHRVFAGASAEVQACLDEGEGAILHCQIEFSRIPEPLPTHATPAGNIELPRKQLTRVLTSFWAPLDRTVVAGGCTVGEEPCAVLVTVRRK